MNIKVGNIIEYNNERYYVAYIDNDNSGKIIAYKCREDSEEAGNLIPIFILSNNYGLDYTKSYQIDINNKKNEISIIGTVDDNFISWFNGIIDCVTSADNKCLLLSCTSILAMILLGPGVSSLVDGISASEGAFLAFFGLFTPLVGYMFNYNKIAQAILTSCMDYVLNGVNASMISKFLSHVLMRKKIKNISMPIPKPKTSDDNKKIEDTTECALGAKKSSNLTDGIGEVNDSFLPIKYTIMKCQPPELAGRGARKRKR